MTTPAGHCHFLGGATEPTREAVRAAVGEHAARGAVVDGLEHVTFWADEGVGSPGDLIARIARRRVAVGIVAGNALARDAAPSPAVRERLPRIVANVRELRDAGARLLVGSDAGIEPGKPHDVLPFAVAQASVLLLGPVGTLRAVTSAAAAACGLAARKGRMAPGFDADILAVDGDPLADPGALRHPRAVLARGRLIG